MSGSGSLHTVSGTGIPLPVIQWRRLKQSTSRSLRRPVQPAARASATSHSQKNYRLKAPELAKVSLSLSEQDDRFQVPSEGIRTPCWSARVPKCASLDRNSMVHSKGIKTPCGSARVSKCASLDRYSMVWRYHLILGSRIGASP